MRSIEVIKESILEINKQLKKKDKIKYNKNNKSVKRKVIDVGSII